MQSNVSFKALRSTAEIASVLRVDPRHVQRLVRDYALPALYVPGVGWISEVELVRRWIAAYAMTKQHPDDEPRPWNFDVNSLMTESTENEPA